MRIYRARLDAQKNACFGVRHAFADKLEDLAFAFRQRRFRTDRLRGLPYQAAIDFKHLVAEGDHIVEGRQVGRVLLRCRERNTRHLPLGAFERNTNAIVQARGFCILQEPDLPFRQFHKAFELTPMKRPEHAGGTERYRINLSAIVSNIVVLPREGIGVDLSEPLMFQGYIVCADDGKIYAVIAKDPHGVDEQDKKGFRIFKAPARDYEL